MSDDCYEKSLNRGGSEPNVGHRELYDNRVGCSKDAGNPVASAVYRPTERLHRRLIALFPP